MPKRIVRQPNGLLAEFSTIVDHFTACHMTEDEALGQAAYSVGRDHAEAKVRRGLDDDMTGIGEPSGKGDGLDRFRDAIETIRLVHGEDEAAKQEADLSAPYDPDQDEDDDEDASAPGG